MEEEKVNINNEHETEYEKAIKKFLDESIDIHSQGEDIEKLAYNSEFDRTNEMLLKYYNEKNGDDLQSTLKIILGIGAYKKLMKRYKLHGKNIDGNEKEEQIRDMSKEVFEDEKVDDMTKERAIKKVEQEEKADSTESLDFKAELMKAVYEEAFERYDSLLTKYKNIQLREESMTVGDKEGTELVLYEKYLKNMEKKYAKYARSKGLDIKELDQDKDIKAKKEKLENDMKKITKSNDLKVEDNILRINILLDRRNQIAEKMLEISENRESMSPEQFKSSMDYYQQEYFDLTVEMRSQDPTLEMYQQDISQENENIEYSNRTIGARSDKIVAGSYQEMDYENKKEDVGDRNINQIQDMSQDFGKTSQKVVSELIEDAQDALEKGDLVHATEVIESAEVISFGREVSYDDSSDDVENINNEEMKEKIDETQKEDQKEDENSEVQEGEEQNSFMQEMESGVASEKEAQLQERLRILKENNTKDENDLQIQGNDLEQQHVRTRFNRKN